MDFSLSPDQLALRDAVRRQCDGEYPLQQRGDVEAPALAQQRLRGLASLGVLGLMLPTAQGGSALGRISPRMMRVWEAPAACAAVM